MQDLLTHPAIQSAVVPFVTALAIMLLLRKRGDVAFGLAIIGGFCATVTMTMGLDFQPLSSTRKIVLVSLGLPFLLPLLALLWQKTSIIGERWQADISIGVPTLLLVSAINWVIWPVLSRQEVSEAWLLVVQGSAYVGFVGAAFLFIASLKRPEKSMAQGLGALSLGLGTAVTSMIAASALYAQLAFSVVAAVAATVGSVWLMRLFRQPSTTAQYGVGYLGPFGLFAAVVSLALIGASATVYAQLPVLVLLCLAAIPVLAGWSPINVQRPWQRLLVTSLLALLPVVPAVWLAWRAAGQASY